MVIVHVNKNIKMNLSQENKAVIYDECLRESDRLQRENSKLKSEHAGNIPLQIQQIINNNDARINVLVKKLESLFD